MRDRAVAYSAVQVGGCGWMSAPQAFGGEGFGGFSYEHEEESGGEAVHFR